MPPKSKKKSRKAKAKAARPAIYCGNNAQDTDLVAGRKRLGTRLECFRRGIGVGLHLPLDRKYAGRYVPIDTRKIYCGMAPRLPQGYHRYGNLPGCLQKGVAVGKTKKAQEAARAKRKKSKKKSKKKKAR